MTGSSSRGTLWRSAPATTVRLLDMEQSGIRVASYWTEALPQKELERKLHDAVRLARAHLAARGGK